MRLTCRNVEAGSWQSKPCIVVKCQKNLLREELRALAVEDGRPLLDRLKDELLEGPKRSDPERVPSAPASVRAVGSSLTCVAQDLKVTRYSTGVLVVDLFILDITTPLESLIGKDIEVVPV